LVYEYSYIFFFTCRVSDRKNHKSRATKTDEHGKWMGEKSVMEGRYFRSIHTHTHTHIHKVTAKKWSVGQN